MKQRELGKLIRITEQLSDRAGIWTQEKCLPVWAMTATKCWLSWDYSVPHKVSSHSSSTCLQRWHFTRAKCPTVSSRYPQDGRWVGKTHRHPSPLQNMKPHTDCKSYHNDSLFSWSFPTNFFWENHMLGEKTLQVTNQPAKLYGKCHDRDFTVAWSAQRDGSLRSVLRGFERNVEQRLTDRSLVLLKLMLAPTSSVIWSLSRDLNWFTTPSRAWFLTILWSWPHLRNR